MDINDRFHQASRIILSRVPPETDVTLRATTARGDGHVNGVEKCLYCLGDTLPASVSLNLSNAEHRVSLFRDKDGGLSEGSFLWVYPMGTDGGMRLSDDMSPEAIAERILDLFMPMSEITVMTPFGYRRILVETLRARNLPTTREGALALALTLESED